MTRAERLLNRVRRIVCRHDWIGSGWTRHDVCSKCKAVRRG